MKIIKTKTYEGYFLKDIKKHLDAVQFAAFSKFFEGQTGVIHEGKLLVYRDDYERFINNLPVID